MLDATLLAALGIVFVAGIISGLTGFGFALVSVPVLLTLYEPAAVVTLTLGLSFFTCMLVIQSAWRSANLRVVLELLPGAFAGLFAGAWLLAIVDAVVIKAFVGTLVVFFSLLMLRGARLRGANSPAAALVAGGLSGTLATTTGLSGPSVVMLLTAREFERDAFRATIASYFICVNVVGYIALFSQGLLTRSHVETTATILPAAVLATFTGSRLARRIPPAVFRRMTLMLVLLTGAIGAVTALVALV